MQLQLCEWEGGEGGGRRREEGGKREREREKRGGREERERREGEEKGRGVSEDMIKGNN